MNTPILAPELETDALRGDLRPSARSPRPIHLPQTCTDGGLRGGR
jgi:hypothetical protein